MKKRYGVDVAVKRADDLDKKLLAYVREHLGTTVLDLGAGQGAHARRLADAGAVVTAIDIGDHSVDENICFIQGDIRDLGALVSEEEFDVCLFQRTVHYLRYEEARLVLKSLRSLVRGRLYISVTGLESDIGERYADRDKSVEERFAVLAAEDMATFSITERLCLYTPEEFMVLLQESGWEIEEFWVSAFGNVKAVCQ